MQHYREIGYLSTFSLPGYRTETHQIKALPLLGTQEKKRNHCTILLWQDDIGQSTFVKDPTPPTVRKSQKKLFERRSSTTTFKVTGVSEECVELWSQRPLSS